MLEVLAAAPSVSQSTSREITLRTTLARALMTTKGYTPDVDEALSQNVALSETGGLLSKQYYSVLRGLVHHYNFKGDIAMGARIGARMIEIAEQERDAAVQIEGQLLIGVGQMFNGDLDGGLSQLDRATALFDTVAPQTFSAPGGGPDPRVAPHYRGHHLVAAWVGATGAGPGRRGAAAGGRARTSSDLGVRLFSCRPASTWLRDFEAAAGQSARLLDLSASTTLASGRRRAPFWAGRAGLGLRDPRRLSPSCGAVSMSIRASAPRRSSGRCCWPCTRRPALGRRGRVKVAGRRRRAGAGQARARHDDAAGVPNPEGATWRRRRQAALDGEAEQWYRTALERSQAIGARISTLKAATRLYRLTADGPGSEAARHSLTGICAAFAQEATFPDLLEARHLLGD